MSFFECEIFVVGHVFAVMPKISEASQNDPRLRAMNNTGRRQPSRITTKKIDKPFVNMFSYQFSRVAVERSYPLWAHAACRAPK